MSLRLTPTVSFKLLLRPCRPAETFLRSEALGSVRRATLISGLALTASCTGFRWHHQSYKIQYYPTN